MNNLYFEGVNTIYVVLNSRQNKRQSELAGTMAAGVTEARANSTIIMPCIVVILIGLCCAGQLLFVCRLMGQLIKLITYRAHY